jgi:hypothetical protein
MKTREMNVRIIEEKGKYRLGFVYQLYKIRKGYEWRDASKSTVERLKTQLAKGQANE